jgi:hypothetical protein
VGGAIGFFSALGVIMVESWLSTRKRRLELIRVLQAVVRECTMPALVAGLTGGPVYVNPAEQFLSTFWKDLALLGTYTHMMTVNYFFMVMDAAKMEGGPSKNLIEILSKAQNNLLVLIDLEAKGQRQNINPDQSQNEW